MWLVTLLCPWAGSSCLGLEPFPKVAGAMGQLVQVDLESAEAAFLILLTRSGCGGTWVPLHVRELWARSIPTW